MSLKNGLNANQLKLIAILAMTVDHVTWTIWPGYGKTWFVVVLHAVGRLTAPIMWFFIAEGYYHTRSVKKYALRLFMLALISHFAYNFCFGRPMLPLQTGIFNQTGVVWALAWGLVLLCIEESQAFSTWQKAGLTILICLVSFPADWSCIAAMAILGIGSNRGNFKAQMTGMMVWTAIYAAVYFLFMDRLYGLLQLCTCLAIPLLRLYNGKRGSAKAMGRLFYFYYPTHMALLGLVRIALRG